MLYALDVRYAVPLILEPEANSGHNMHLRYRNHYEKVGLFYEERRQIDSNLPASDDRSALYTRLPAEIHSRDAVSATERR